MQSNVHYYGHGCSTDARLLRHLDVSVARSLSQCDGSANVTSNANEFSKSASHSCSPLHQPFPPLLPPPSFSHPSTPLFTKWQEISNGVRTTRDICGFWQMKATKRVVDQLSCIRRNKEHNSFDKKTLFHVTFSLINGFDCKGDNPLNKLSSGNTMARDLSLHF